MSAGNPGPPRAPDAWHPAPAQTPGQGIRVRARATGTHPPGPNQPGGPGRAHPPAGPEMPSPTCHFAWSCCRGCGRRRRLEPPSVRARGCARVSPRSWRCGSLTAPGATAPSPRRSGRQAPSRLSRPRPPAGPRPSSSLPASRSPRLRGARSSPPRRAGVSAGSSAKRRAGSAGSLCPPARRAGRFPGSRPLRPPRALRTRLLSPRVSLLVLASRLRSPSSRLADPTCPGYGACPVRRARAGLGVGRGRAGRRAAASPRGWEGAPGGPGQAPGTGSGESWEMVGGAPGEAAQLPAPLGSPRPPPADPASQHGPCLESSRYRVSRGTEPCGKWHPLLGRPTAPSGPWGGGGSKEWRGVRSGETGTPKPLVG